MPTLDQLDPRHQIGMEIRTLHQYGFRCGKWARITACSEDTDHGACWLVEFPDGVQDWWVVGDPDGNYELRQATINFD